MELNAIAPDFNESNNAKAPFDITIIIIPLNKYRSCKTIDEVMEKAQETRVYISQTHSSATLNFKEMDKGLYEQDPTLEAWVNIDGVWASVGFLASFGITPPDILGLSGSLVKLLGDAEKLK